MALVTVDSAQITSFIAAFGTLKTDVTTALKDFADKLAAIGSATPDPATAAAITAVIGDITAFDGTVKAADPGPVTPVAPPAGQP